MSTPGTNPSAPERPRPWPGSQGEWLALAAVVAVALAARLFRLGNDSFWLDETASWWFASRPFNEQWGQIPFYEPHPPLYYTLLWVWSRLFGEGEAGLRGLSAFASVLTIPVVHGLGRLAVRGREGMWIGLLAAALTALYPTQIFFAQEARAYALLTLAMSLLMLSLLWLLLHPELLDRPVRMVLQDRVSGVRAAICGVIAATVAAFWLHNTAILLAGSLLLFAAVLVLVKSGWSWRLVGNFAAIGLTIFVLWAPNIRWLLSGFSEITTGFWLQPPGWRGLLYGGDELLGSGNVATDEAWKLRMIVLSLLLTLAGTAAVWRRGQAEAALFLLGAVAVPVGVCLLVTYLVTPIFMPRVLLWIEIPVAVLVAASMLWLPTPFLRSSAAAIVSVFFAVVIILGWGRAAKEPWREVAWIVADESQADDLIVLDTPYAQVPMLYYRLAERSPARWLPLPDAYPDPVGPGGYPNGFFVRDEIDAATLTRVQEAARTSRRVWHVARGRTSYDWKEQLGHTLRETHPAVTPRVYSGEAILLTEYAPASASPSEGR